MEAYVAPDGYAEQYKNPYIPPDLRSTPGDWYEELPNYYGICKRIDECYGRILDSLRSESILDETIVLFTSDHGSHFRTRNDEYKRSCHESSIRVPAVIRGPGFDSGRAIDELVSLLDVPPTLLDAANIDPPKSMRGQSVRRLLADDDFDWREEVFIQISEAEVGRAIRTDRWKYAVYAPEKDPEIDPSSGEYVERYLYDLRADPYEQKNLIGHVDYRDIAVALRERLVDRIHEVEGEASVRTLEYYG
jgi:arylsulfatase A-like enzyme